MLRFLFSPRSHPPGRKLFAVTALAHKLFFERSNLLIQQIVCLIDQADQCIGPHGTVFVFKPRRV